MCVEVGFCLRYSGLAVTCALDFCSSYMLCKIRAAPEEELMVIACEWRSRASKGSKVSFLALQAVTQNTVSCYLPPLSGPVLHQERKRQDEMMAL